MWRRRPSRLTSTICGPPFSGRAGPLGCAARVTIPPSLTELTFLGLSGSDWSSVTSTDEHSLLLKGVSLDSVSKLLGHSSIHNYSAALRTLGEGATRATRKRSETDLDVSGFISTAAAAAPFWPRSNPRHPATQNLLYFQSFTA